MPRFPKTAKSPKALVPLALLGVLAMGWASWTALAATGPPAPTITSSPANPTSATTATFVYNSAGATGYQCKLDAALLFTPCPSSGITYGSALLPLPQGTHSFQVFATDKQGRTSATTSYSWVIDRAAPTTSSIIRAGANPTKASPLRWTVTFSEPVRNVTTGNFALVTGGLGGTPPSITSATPSGTSPSTTWTVTAATTGTTAGNAGSIGLNLASKGTIQDAAGNPLAGSVPVVGEAYIFDTTAPTTGAVTIVRSSSSPTNAASVSWTVTFGEPVNGGGTSNFALTAGGLSGTSISSVTGAGATRTVTASTGAGSGTLQLRLSSASGISDLAGNALTGAVPVNGPTYDVDRAAPPVAFTTRPPDPNATSTSTFAWISQPSAADFHQYECSAENGPFSTQVQSQGGSPQPCSSPLTYVVGTTNNGQHQFAVRAYDVLGNFTQITYTWKVAAGSGQNFTMSGDAVGQLFPGAPAKNIAVTLTNPNPVPIFVTDVQATITANSKSSAGCSTAANFVVTQSDVSSATPVQVPANGFVTLPAQGRSAPTIEMPNLDVSQDACKNASLTLSYTGNAHS
jgi:hypothetical protein